MSRACSDSSTIDGEPVTCCRTDHHTEHAAWKNGAVVVWTSGEQARPADDEIVRQGR